MTASGPTPRTAAPAARESPPLSVHVLVVEDDDAVRLALLDALEEEGCTVYAVADGQAALAALESRPVDVVLLDLHLPRVSGLSVLSALPSVPTDARVIVMTAFGTVDSAVEAMKLGAWDYVRKPVESGELLRRVRRAAEDVALRREVVRLRSSPVEGMRFGMVGRSAAMERVYRLIARVAPTRATVLVTGETGTGKELVARAVHEQSDRSARPFVAVNCSALPDTLLESELFGYVKGSFTGAVQSRPGLIEEAAGGTLFLDEVSTLSEDIQVKLLRVIQDRQVQRIGGRRPTMVDFRLVAATNADLRERVEQGRFREDFYYRLDVFPIRVPPLRERREDVPLLAQHFRMRFARDNGIEAPALRAETLSRMMAYPWPGNVRELESFVERAAIMHAGEETLPFDLPHRDHAGAASGLVRQGAEAGWTLERLEREYILAVLERTRWQQARAAEILGLNRRTVYRKLTRYREEGLLPGVDLEADGD